MRGKLLAVFNFTLAPCAALLLCASMAQTARAQSTQRQARDARTAPPSSTTSNNAAEPAPRAEEPAAEPDLSITAHVTADSLRFEKVPNPKVEFTGRPRRDTVWKSERENIPEQVQPGVTYRNVGITLRITSVFADIDRIVAEALGEVPAGDDAQPQTTPPLQPGAQSESRLTTKSESQRPRAEETPSPAKAHARAAARGRAGRRGRGM
jgi:hypothetical protein